MHTYSLFLNEACNLDCAFCSRHTSDLRAQKPVAEVLGEVQRLPEGLKRLVLTGGEPSLHPGFLEVLEAAQGRGVEAVEVETNAVRWADREFAGKAASAGLRRAFVMLPSHIEERYAQVTRRPGILRQALLGTANLLESGVEVNFVLPAVSELLGELEATGRWLNERFPSATGLFIATIDPRRKPFLAPFRPTAEAVGGLFRFCAKRRWQFGFQQPRGLPACAAEGLLAYQDLFTLRHQSLKYSGEKVQRIDACESCAFSRICPGIEASYLAAFGETEFQPLTADDLYRWAPKKPNRLEAKTYITESDFHRPQEEAAAAAFSLLRINYRCNMACPFCFVDREQEDIDPGELKERVRRVAAGGAKKLVISGGEPTLHPALAELVRFAREQGIPEVELQTNGVRFADRAFAETLRDAGLTTAILSLHSYDESTANTITRLPDGYRQTVEGIKTLRALGVETKVCIVVNTMNFQHLPGFVEFCHHEFGEEPKPVELCILPAMEMTENVQAWNCPTFTEMKKPLREALDYLLEEDIEFGGLGGQGGLPPCVLGGEMRYYPDFDRLAWSNHSDGLFTKVAACGQCDLNPKCLGIRKSYIERYGDGEIVPVKLAQPVTAS